MEFFDFSVFLFFYFLRARVFSSLIEVLLTNKGYVY